MLMVSFGAKDRRNTGIPVFDLQDSNISLSVGSLGPFPLVPSLFSLKLKGYWSGCHIRSGIECGESSGRSPLEELNWNDNSHSCGR